jgi:hypothetical protein
MDTLAQVPPDCPDWRLEPDAEAERTLHEQAMRARGEWEENREHQFSVSQQLPEGE